MPKKSKGQNNTSVPFPSSCRLMPPFETIKKKPFVGLLLSRLGYQVDRKKDCSTWRALVSPSGVRILVPRDPASSGDFLYKSCDLSLKNGSIVDLLHVHHQMSFREILDFFLVGDRLPIAPIPIEKKRNPPKNQSKEARKTLVDFYFRAKKHPGFCLGSRGISKEVCDVFQLPMTRDAVVFPLFELVGDRFLPKTTIRYTCRSTGKSQKLFQKGLRKGASASIFLPLCMHFCSPVRKKVTTMCICESPVDALSWAQLLLRRRKNIQNHLFLATCGALSRDFKANLPNILDFFSPEKIQICMDNDDKGREMSRELCAILKSFGSTILRLPEGRKDLNDLLEKGG